MFSKEEQRYGRNKSTSISHSYIDSGEYRKKFDSISSDKELNRLLYSISKEMLYHRTGTRYEDMYWIDMESLEVVYKITDSTTEGKIMYTDRVKQLIQERKGLITIHSHPSGCPPSIEDFNSSCVNGYSFGVVCGHNGTIFIYSSNEIVPAESYYYLYGKYYKQCISEYEAQLLALKDLSKRYDIYFKEVSVSLC